MSLKEQLGNAFEAIDAFERENKEALKAYDEATQPAEILFRETTTQFREEYEAEQDRVLSKFKRVMDKARKEAEDANALANAKFRKQCEPAEALYKAATAHEKAIYDAAEKAANEKLEKTIGKDNVAIFKMGED